MELKLCKDCKWSGSGGGMGFNNLKCHYSRNISPATGHPEFSCETHRTLSWLQAVLMGMCGRSGRWFEKKEKTQ